ncbi:MAG: zinc metalloprotease HtpX [Nitrospirota bacterium]|nr:zinc metalloprotease HtpX [Nitrospirota bacterium]
MNALKTAFLLTLLTLLLMFAGQVLGGQTGMVIALAFAVAMNFFAYWYSDRMVLRMSRAREVSEAEAPQLHSVVRELATRASLPMPKVYLIDDPSPNAFATGRNPEHAAVAATTGIMRILDRNELSGVMAHELAHVGNRDILIGAVAATIAGAISMLANIAQFAMIFGGHRHDDGENHNPLMAIVMMIVAPIAAMLVQMAISRSREYGADRRGAEICGNPLWLASALRKLERGIDLQPMAVNPSTAHMYIANPLRGGGLMALFSTHPPMAERVSRLEAMAAAPGSGRI